MKKALITLTLILATYVIIGAKAEELVEIPNEAIRIRVIGNSNSEYDQEKKQELRKDVQLYMQSLLKDAKTINQAREIINNNLDNINTNVDNYLHNLNYDTSYNIILGIYSSSVITLIIKSFSKVYTNIEFIIGLILLVLGIFISSLFKEK